MTQYNYKETKRKPARYLNASSNLSPQLLSKYIADPTDTETGYQTWIVGRVYSALRRCAAQHAEYPTHDQLIYMVVDRIARFSSMPWDKTRSGSGRKARSYDTPCLHCADCVECQQDIDRDRKANAKTCLHPKRVNVSAKAGKPLPHDLRTWRTALLNQCYHSGYIKARGWLASDERPAAIAYMKSFRDVQKMQSLKPLDVVSKLYCELDQHPQIIRYAEAQLNGLIDSTDAAVAGMMPAQTASEYRNGKLHKTGGEEYVVGAETIAKKLGIGRRITEDSMKRVEAVLKGLPTKRRQGASKAAPPQPLPAKPRSVPAPTPAPTADELAWTAAVDQWKQSQRIAADRSGSGNTPPAPTPLWQELGMVDPELLTEQIASKARQLDAMIDALPDAPKA